jgi:hypothetical protein
MGWLAEMILMERTATAQNKKIKSHKSKTQIKNKK